MTPRTKRRLQRIAATFNARARLHHVPGVVTWFLLLAAGDHCHYCGIELEIDHGSWDHKVSLDHGGTNDMVNIVRCCVTCQREKHTKTPAEYTTHREMIVRCANASCRKAYKPRWAEWLAGRARYCSHRCAGTARGKESR